ncbi:MAG: DUF2283 domain-containing protein [Caldilineaceae bacterium]
MLQEPTYSYDKEVNILYISFSPGEHATSAVELNENILLRFNKAEKRAIGLTLMDFSILIELTNIGPRSFPLTGLADLDPEWQEMVLEMISRPPVNQILKLQAYTPSLTMTTPATIIERPGLLAMA